MTITSYDPRDAMDLAPGEADHPLPAWVALLAPAAELAETLAHTEFVPKELRGRPAAIAAVILYGFEVNIGPMQALGSMDVIQGKPTPSAELLRALIYSAGHDMWVVEATQTRVTVGGRRNGSPRETTITWTSEMARAAGLTGNPSWKKYPRAMLMARATSELARAIFPDAIHGLGTLADLADVPVTDTAPPIEAAAANAATMRRTRRRTVTPGAGDSPDPAPGQTDDAAPVSDGVPDIPPADASPPTDTGAVTREQFARMNIAFRDMGVEDRNTRLRMVSGIVGRKLDTSQELTRDEASKVISALDDSQTLGIPVPTWPDDDNPV
jgi:hypothetical protein